MTRRAQEMLLRTLDVKHGMDTGCVWPARAMLDQCDMHDSLATQTVFESKDVMCRAEMVGLIQVERVGDQD